ncbi:right-handed parallel beta-helix repeat-containing protein [Luteolibacter flavescens]|uniref:Right-handed parallel beta-helix repeat-containing protein n=1 Tax=Luteolibacter flavescens TaxID=1859460 RepID=A0ABT3FKS8_9BACT|nr:right-handed parallel beta-helix repeat-containing protein [Luteolibacter flavescens]MCW1884184.1 right-handed parallel beta-helix repeat-containing protein [Luteolibacter flavescens]
MNSPGFPPRRLTIRLWKGVVALGLPVLAHAEPRLVAGAPSGGNIPLIWSSTPGRIYRVQTSDSLQTWSALPPAVETLQPLLASSTTMSLSAPAAGPRGFYRVSEDLYIDPPWADAKPLRTIFLSYNSTQTALVNGATLRTAMLALIPGDQLVIAPGTYSISSLTDLVLNGTAQNPIRIVAGSGGSVVITRPDANQNVLNIGTAANASYLSLEGLEITGGSSGLRFGTCSNVRVDRCKIHHTGNDGIQANSRPIEKAYFTRNQIHDIGAPDAGGAGIYLGGVSTVAKQSVIAMNRIARANGSSLGYGIFVRDGSWGNLIAGNVVEDCELPGITVFGTAGNPVNVVEHNVCLPGDDYGLHVQKECIVRNNVVFGGEVGAFASIPLSGQNPTKMTVVNNTFIAEWRAVRLGSWSAGTDNLFANNACYSQTADAIFLAGSAGATVFSGLVTFGTRPSGVSSIPGTGLGDFTNVTWNGASHDVTPTATSPLRGAATASHASMLDLGYRLRTAPHVTGASR